MTTRSFHFSGSSLPSVQVRCSVESDSLRLHGLQHARPPCPSSTPGVYPNSHPLSWWCHPTISSSVIPFSSCLQSFPASGSFPMSQFFTSGSQSLELQLQHQSFQWVFKTDLFYGWLAWSPGSMDTYNPRKMRMSTCNNLLQWYSYTSMKEWEKNNVLFLVEAQNPSCKTGFMKITLI